MRSTSHSSPTNTIRRLALATAIAVFTVGCGNSDAEYTVNEILDGIPLDPALYDINNQQCTKLDDRVQLEFDLTNNETRDRFYRLEFTYTTANGTAWNTIGEGEKIEAGQTRTITDWTSKPNEYSNPPDCDVQVLVSMSEVLEE